jgi:hypothetical protein
MMLISSPNWKNVRLRVTGVLFAALALTFQTFSESSPEPKLTSFDVPGAIATAATGINGRGEIIGTVTLADFTSHLFVRSPHGDFTLFDVPGVSAYAAQINESGEIVGSTLDGNLVHHGFVRNPHGKITIVDAPGAGQGNLQGTTLVSINNRGETTGSFIDSNGISHGFLRTGDGDITPFDDPSAGKNTVPESINDFGAVSGVASPPAYGFLRTRRGDIFNFQCPQGPEQGILPNVTSALVNDRGVVEGDCEETVEVSPGYVRAPDGAITEFAAPGDELSEPFIVALNDRGTSTGWVYEGFPGPTQSFVRFADGTLVIIDFSSEFPSERISMATAINARNVVVGWWTDINDGLHGYIWSQK